MRFMTCDRLMIAAWTRSYSNMDSTDASSRSWLLFLRGWFFISPCCRGWRGWMSAGVLAFVLWRARV